MFQPKACKREKQDKDKLTPYDDFLEHPRTLNSWRGDSYTIISIDPGIVSYGIRLERRKRIMRSMFEDVNSDIDIVTDRNRLKKIGRGETIYMERWQLAPHRDTYPINVLLSILQKKLNWFYQSFPEALCVHIFIIERQLPHNYKSVRIQQHTLTDALSRLRSSELSPYICEVDPKFKGQGMLVPKDLNETQLKEWSVVFAEAYMKHWNDVQGLQVYNQTKKKDDISDTVTQIEGVLFYWGFTRDHLPRLNTCGVRDTAVLSSSTFSVDISSLMPVQHLPSVSQDTKPYDFASENSFSLGQSSTASSFSLGRIK